MTSAGWKVRRAGIDDIRVMTSLLRELVSAGGDAALNVYRQRAGLRRLIAEKNNVVLVAENDGLVVGMCTVQTVVSTAEGALDGLLQDMVVHGKFRGRGIGKALLAAAERWADEHKLGRLQFLVDKADADTLKFCESRGWRTTDLVCVRKPVGRRQSG